MIKVVLLDDHKQDLERLYTFISNYPDFEIVSFSKSDECFEYLCKNDVDVAFMDIEVNGQKTIDLVKKLSNKMIVVYVTHYPRYAKECIGLQTLKFIEKKDLEKEINETLEELITLFSKKNQVITFPYQEQELSLLLKDIVSIHYSTKYITVCYEINADCFSKIKVRMFLKTIENELNELFFRIDKAVIINYLYIKEMGKDYVILKDETRWDISRNKQKEFILWFHQLRRTRNLYLNSTFLSI